MKVNFEYKQAIIVREDLKLSKGKIAVQVAHAAIEAYERADEKIKEAWRSEGQKKVVLKVSSLSELLELKAKAERLGFACALIADAGLTEVPPGTITALGIGPDKAERLDALTGNLKLL
jgi:PTH2 family peptidyl-tRNA hydrolase